MSTTVLLFPGSTLWRVLVLASEYVIAQDYGKLAHERKKLGFAYLSVQSYLG
jgi:hypothetical protein